jgi:hypothetical protein
MTRRLIEGYVRIAIGVCALIGIPVAIIIALVAMKATFDVAGFGLLDGLLLTVVVLIVSPWATASFQHGKRLVAAAQDEIALDKKVDFILYLRGFIDDTVASSTLGEPEVWQQAFANLFGLPLTEEEHLARALKAFCPVAAVGRPGEELPLLGARRIYLDDAIWQDRVRELMHRARLVVVRLGPDEGLTWELQVALHELPPEKVVLLVPDRGSPRGLSRGLSIAAYSDVAWDRLKEVLQASQRELQDIPELAEPSPRLGTLRGLICFSRGGQPIVYPLTNRSVARRLSRYALADALEDVFAPLMARVFGHKTRRRLVFRRATALVVDGLVFQLVTFIVAAFAVAFELNQTFLFFEGVLLAYWLGAEAVFRQTLGKRAVGLQVAPLQDAWFFGKVSIRNAAKVATVATLTLPEPFGIWTFAATCILPLLVWRAPLHDLLSGTTVIGAGTLAALLKESDEVASPSQQRLQETRGV